MLGCSVQGLGEGGRGGGGGGCSTGEEGTAVAETARVQTLCNYIHVSYSQFLVCPILTPIMLPYITPLAV